MRINPKCFDCKEGVDTRKQYAIVSVIRYGADGNKIVEQLNLYFHDPNCTVDPQNEVHLTFKFKAKQDSEVIQ